jgi:hypothetical protein
LAAGLLAAVGGLAIGGIALGGMAIGYYAHGGGAVGEHVYSATIADPEAVRFFGPWATQLLRGMGPWLAAFMLAVFTVNFGAMRWAMAKQRAKAATLSVPPGSTSVAGGEKGVFVSLIAHFLPAILLAILWFTGGLEKGAVMILSVVVVATLVIGALRPKQRGVRWFVPFAALALCLGLGAYFLNKQRSPSPVETAAPQLKLPAAMASSTKPVPAGISTELAVGDSFPTLAEALASAPENAVIRLPEGTFKEHITITKPVKIIGAGWDKTRLEASGDPAAIEGPEARPAKPLVSIRTEGDVLLEGLGMSLRTEKSHDVASQRIAVVNSEKAKLTMRGCAVIGSPGNGIEVRDAAGGLIENCLVAGVWGTGIELVGNRITVLNSDVRNCYHRGITISDQRWGKTTIRGCRISGSAWHGIRYDDCSPLITGCVITGNARSGIYVSGNTVGEIFGNVLARNEMGSISCWYESRDRIVRNIIADDKREGLAVLGLASPLVRGNIFVGKGIVQSQIGDDRLTAKAYGTPKLENNVFWKVDQPHQRGFPVEAVPLPEGNRVEDPGLGGNYELPEGSKLRDQQIGPEVNPVVESAFPVQPEEKAIIPDAESRDFKLWKGRG